MKIKTITAQTPTEFDNAVNAALAEGYELKRRDVLPPGETMTCGYPRLYYAELVLETSCDNCRHEACDPDDPSLPCYHCVNDNRWEACGS